MLHKETLFSYNFWLDCLGYGGIWLVVLFAHEVFNVSAIRKSTFFFRKVISVFLVSLVVTIITRALIRQEMSDFVSNVYKNASIALIVTLFLLLITLHINRSNEKRILIVGGGKTGRAVVRELLAQRIIKCSISGFISDKVSDSIEIYDGDEIEEIRSVPHGTIAYLGQQSDLIAILKTYCINFVVIAKDRKLDKNLVSDIESLKRLRTTVYFADEIFEIFSRKIPVLHLNSDYFYYLFRQIEKHEQEFTFYGIVTRVGNILMGIVGLILTAPIMIIFGFVFCCVSRGPVFFSQDRVGKDGKVFKIYKLRTMRVHDPKKHSKYSSKNDPRIPWLGKIMRKLRVDEFPQFWNILAGNMNFVGPRPEWTELVEKYQKEIPFYHQRHIVRPGITGWAQVNYSYGSSVKDSIYKLQYDLYYVKNANILLDVLIVLKTIRIMLSGKGV